MSEDEKIISCTELLNKPHIEPKFYVDKMIPQQATIVFAGESGLGKTHFILSFIMAAQTRRMAFERLSTMPMSVLYFTEDNDIVTNDYVRRVGVNFPNFDTDYLSFGRGVRNISEVRRYIEMYSPDLVVVDPLSSINPVKNDSDNQSVRNFIDDVKLMCRKHNISFLFTRHMSKADVKVVYDAYMNRGRVLGAQEFMAAPDQRLILMRDNTGKFIIAVSGKYHKEWKAEITIDTEAGSLILEGGPEIKEESKKKISQYREPLLRVFENHPNVKMKASVVAAVLDNAKGIPFSVNADAVRKELHNMVIDNVITKDEDGAYQFISGIGGIIERAHQNNPRFATPLGTLSEDETAEE
jgi:KaiC/GvpD/RAD55 family RecA-like ATPase